MDDYIRTLIPESFGPEDAFSLEVANDTTRLSNVAMKLYNRRVRVCNNPESLYNEFRYDYLIDEFKLLRKIKVEGIKQTDSMLFLDDDMKLRLIVPDVKVIKTNLLDLKSRYLFIPIGYILRFETNHVGVLVIDKELKLIYFIDPNCNYGAITENDLVITNLFKQFVLQISKDFKCSEAWGIKSKAINRNLDSYPGACMIFTLMIAEMLHITQICPKIVVEGLSRLQDEKLAKLRNGYGIVLYSNAL
jgi:hypothetical protein